jgi:hypothetical protein
MTIVALVLIRRRSRATISVNLALSGLRLPAVVAWQFLGLKSPAGDRHRRHTGAGRSLVFPDLEEGEE